MEENNASSLLSQPYKKQVKIKKILYTAENIQARVMELGKQISHDYAGKELVLVGILKGAIYFYSDLTRAISIPIGIDFISIGTIPITTKQTGIVRITKELDLDIKGKHVLLVEDIVRTGLTTAYLLKNLETKKPASIKICSLLHNPDQLLLGVPITYYGYEINQSWLLGYGMDKNDFGRNLPYLAEIEKDGPDNNV